MVIVIKGLTDSIHVRRLTVNLDERKWKVKRGVERYGNKILPQIWEDDSLLPDSFVPFIYLLG